MNGNDSSSKVASTRLAVNPLLSPPIRGLDQIGRLVLLGEIARGGMGIVYRAHDPTIGREVAVKVLGDRLTRRPDAVRRFLDEARVTGQLQHPSVPPVFEVGELPDGRPYLAMKLVNGQTLADLLAARKKLDEDRGRFVTVFEQVCQAVAYAHSRGVIHRDLKPQNIMVGLFGEVQVMDWGLAKTLVDQPAGSETVYLPGLDPNVDMLTASAEDLTRTGTVLGTPAFMPPEQARGEVAKIDRRADVFGLGAVLCVMLTGQPPYLAKSLQAVRAMSVAGDLTGAFVRLDGCGAEFDLVSLCKRCLCADPDDRHADAGEVAAAVVGFRIASEELGRRREASRRSRKALDTERRMRRELETDIMFVIRLFQQFETCGADPALAALGMRCFSADPATRFQTLAELNAALEGYREKLKSVKKVSRARKVKDAEPEVTGSIKAKRTRSKTPPSPK